IFSLSDRGTSHEAPRVRPVGRRSSDDVADRRACAAECDPGDRVPKQHLAWPECAVLGRVPPGAGGNRLRRRPKFGNRIPLGGEPSRSTSDIGRRSRRPQGRHARDRRRPPSGAGGETIAAGLVASLARPEGNVTGFSIQVVELNPKRLDLLSALLPEARVIALLVNPKNPSSERVIRDVQEAARTKGVQLPIVKAASESEIDAAFASLVQLQAGALVVGSDP